MNKIFSLTLISLAGWAIVGCGGPAPPSVGPAASSSPAETPADLTQVTLYLANMNKDLKIL